MTGHTLLKVREAAQYLGVTESFLNNRRLTGGGPQFYTVGRSIRYTPEDLDAWLRDQRRASTSEYASA